MRNFKITIIVVLAIAYSTTLAIAQRPQPESYIQSRGLMLGKDAMTIEDMFEISQTQFNFGTARSMAMGGAFTSLGADLSSMSTNPAGLGMYQGGDISITPLISLQRATNSAESNGNGSNRKNKFSISNFGFATNIYNGSGSVISITLGLGYNRVQDLNYNYSFATTGNTSSIADAYSKMLDYSGIDPSHITDPKDINWGNLGNKSLFWPAILGYRTGMTDHLSSTDKWSPSWIGSDRNKLYQNPDGTYSGIDIGQSVGIESVGSIGEYLISAGMNISNKLYIGASVGIQSVHQTKYYYYGEDYYYEKNGYGYATGSDGNIIPEQLAYSNLDQVSIINGVGINFKLGLTYRPIKNLRLAVAVHTPTHYALDREYQAAASSLTFSNLEGEEDLQFAYDDATNTLIDDGDYGWSFTSPTKLLLGASYTFGYLGVISVDYQRDWYSNMRLKDSPIGLQDEYRSDAQSLFKGSNTIRVGLEIKPLPALSIRGGFGYSGSWLQDENVVTSSPINKSTTYYSAGLGFRLSRSTYLDIAYSYQTNEQTDYRLFEVNEFDTTNNNISSNMSDLFSSTFTRHNAVMTFGVRF